MLPENKSPLTATPPMGCSFINEASLVIFLGVVLAMIYFIRYKRKSEDDKTPVLRTTILEITWSVVIVIFIVFGGAILGG